MLHALAYLQSLMAKEDGATAVEYGLLVALIAAVIIGAVLILGNAINGAFGTINSSLGAS